MSFENFNNDLIFQIDNDIYYNGREPESDPELPQYEYSFFVFTKYNEDSEERWEFPELSDDWTWIGGSTLGHWRENQFSGPGPVDKLYKSEMEIRSRLNEYVSRGILTDFKIRYRFPTVV